MEVAERVLPAVAFGAEDRGVPKPLCRGDASPPRGEDFDVGTIILMGTANTLSDAARAARPAPFPDDAHKAGARVFPPLVPTSPDDFAAADQRRADAGPRLAEIVADFIGETS